MIIKKSNFILQYIILTEDISHYCLIVQEVLKSLSDVPASTLSNEMVDYLSQYYDCDKLKIKLVSKEVKNMHIILEMSDILYSDDTILAYCI